MICPVKVFQHKHHQAVRRRCLDRLGHLTQHPFARHRPEPGPRGRESGGGAEPRPLREPPRRVPAEERREGVSVWSTTEPTEGFEHGEVRFTGPVVLDALPTPDVELPVPIGCPQEGVDERRLAEPGLSGDEDDLAAPGSRPLERVVETVDLRSPPDRYEPGVRGRAFAGTPWRQDHVGAVARIPPGAEVPHEPMPAAVDGLDEEGGACVVPERLPQLPDAYHENNCGHPGSPPDG